MWNRGVGGEGQVVVGKGKGKGRGCNGMLFVMCGYQIEYGVVCICICVVISNNT
jgi:hypothetical protein